MIGYAINDPLVKNLGENADIGLTLVRRRAIMASTFNQDDKRLKTIPMQWAGYQSMLQRPEAISKLLFNNVSYFSHARRLKMMEPLQEGSILFTVPAEQLDRIKNNLLWEFALLFLILFLLISISGWRFANHLLNPLHQLYLFSSSDPESQLEPFGTEINDEVGALAQHFNILISDVQDKNMELEQRVEERTNELLAAKEMAEAANLAKSNFLSSMSHELRTPMNAILGFSQIMELDATLPEKHRKNTREILTAGDHLLNLINEVLDLAKIESGRIDFEMESVALYPLIEESKQLVSTLAEQRNIQINADYGDVKEISVNADPIRLKQVLINLLSNAIKYNRLEGSVKIELQNLKSDRIRILVIDTGHGIRAGDLQELFVPFSRLDAKNSDIEGTGIGLTITRNIIELMGGTIGVESEVGVGSTFWIELPVNS